MDDSFMKSLAEGGFQVEEYARQHYHGGLFIEANYQEYDFAHEDTIYFILGYLKINLYTMIRLKNANPPPRLVA
jgi:hypothetical protein